MDEISAETKNPKQDTIISTSPQPGQPSSPALGNTNMPVPSPRASYGVGIKVVSAVFVFVLLALGAGVYYYISRENQVPSSQPPVTKVQPGTQTSKEFAPEFIREGFISSSFPDRSRYVKSLDASGVLHHMLTIVTNRTPDFAVEQYTKFFKDNNWQYRIAEGTTPKSKTIHASVTDDLARSAIIEVKPNEETETTFIYIDYSATPAK